MTKLFIFLFLSFFFFISSKHAQAILFIPALVLIPVAKIIALFIAGFSIPAVGISTILNKFQGKPFLKTLTLSIGVVILLAIAGGFILKIVNPNRPLF